MKGIVKNTWIVAALLFLSIILPGCPGGEEGRGGADVRNILTEIERSVFEQVNQYRIDQGLKPLALETNIVIQARNHSKNMGEGIVPFGHEGLQERTAATGIKIGSASENVAYNQGSEDPATYTVQGWLRSEGHRLNIVGDFNLTGIGVVKNESGRLYYTQIFIRSAEQTGFDLSRLWFRER